MRMTINLGGIPIGLNLIYEEARRFFLPYSDETAAPAALLSVSDEDWADAEKRGLPKCGQIEASILTAHASAALLSFNRIIIHAAAFSKHGKAWLITAPPHVGKSTQVRFLMDKYPGEFSVICGDRPVLERKTDGGFIVHPSPWNGKEGWHGAPAAPLAGILCLARGEETTIRRLKEREAVIPVYNAVISYRETEDEIHMISSMETSILKAVSVYEYINGGVPESTDYLYRFLMEGDDYDI